MAPIRSPADLDKLRNIYDEITFRTSALEGLGVSPDEYAPVLRRVIMKALPPELVEAREEGALDQASSSPSQRHHARESRPLELNPPSAAAPLIQSLGGCSSEVSFAALPAKEGQSAHFRYSSTALNCPVEGVEWLTLFTFLKTHRPVTLTCNRVSATLRSQHNTNKTTLDALEESEISAVTSPPADGVIITMMTNLGLVPACARPDATTFREDEISILLGSDFYWDVGTGQVSRLLAQVTAVETRFGWTDQETLLNFSKGSTVQSTSLVFGTGEPPRDDAPTKSPEGKKRPPPTRLSTRNKRGSRSLTTMFSCTPNGN
ncbi:hypothetical protein HPB49_006285 [Dermacentor silvarum]|uniref:Uncharacterized protein n=1 Tax=Dermacentor silvarum TaxID=543639 RepID=A0ACB8DWJ9_DERSI|nr:hypothetical protein HPB49_006285 [Dermacentor silvarum]